MDNSTQSTVEIIQQLKNSFSDCEQLWSIINKLLKNLEKEESAEHLPEVISLLLGSVVQVLPLDELDSSFLKPFLLLTNNFLSKKLTGNHKIIDEGTHLKDDSLLPDVLRSIEVCIQVLVDIDGLLTYLISSDRLRASDFCSAPKNIAETVYLVFSHCQKSKTEYKDVFTAVRSELMSLFQQCYQVQVKLYTFLNENLVFDCAFEEDVETLVDIIDILNSMSEVVAELDTMSLVAHWKGFAQLTQTYSAHLCSRLDVARPITYLSANIAHQLDNLNVYVKAEKKVVLRALKISSLQLKVLIKLCEQYKNYLGDCHRPLLRCLLALATRSTQSLMQDGLSDEVSAQVTTHLSAGAAPLLTHLLADPLFVENYFKYGDELQSSSVSERFGYCNLTNMILKKLAQPTSVDDEVKELWLKPSLPLVENTYKILHHCTDVFCIYKEDPYQALLTHAAAFVIVTTSEAEFPVLERLLMKHLLQPSLWPAIFTSDLLCLIARVGSSELCLQLAVLMSDLCSCWPVWDRCRPEWGYVSWTLSRLVQFLRSEDLRAFPSRLPAVAEVGSDLTTLMRKPPPVESIQLYESLLDRMTMLRDHLGLFPDAKAVLAQPIYQLWQHMILPADVGSTESSHWYCNLIVALVPVTSHIIDHLDNVQIGNILDVLVDICPSSSTAVKCGACTFLKSLANKCLFSDSNKTVVCSKVSSLFVLLMLDRNPLVKQFALETFAYFAYVTKYEEIVVNTVAKDSNLQSEITKYLEGVPIKQSNTAFTYYITHLNAPFVHKCKQNRSNVNVSENPEMNPCKKLKTSLADDSGGVTFERLTSTVDAIEELNKKSELNPAQISILKCVAKRIQKIVERF